MDTLKNNKRYGIISILKKSPDYTVYKGFYYTRFLRKRTCIIKEGSRFTRARLKWQAHVHKVYAAQEYVPKCIDYLEDVDSACLVLEHINGISLSHYLKKINQGHKSWYELPPFIKKQSIQLLLDIINTIGRFHRKGYIHRAISAQNIFIDRQRKVYLINASWAWSGLLHSNHPPFFSNKQAGLPPEQIPGLVPTEKEDVFGLGVLMIELFTGLCPVSFLDQNNKSLLEDLYFLTGSKPIAGLIESCLAQDPVLRPNLESITHGVKAYEQEMETSGYTIYSFHCIQENTKTLKEVLFYAVRNLSINANSFTDTSQIRNRMLTCLQFASNNCDLATGAARRGVLLMLGQGHLEQETFFKLLQDNISFIMKAQEADGSWQQHPGFMQGTAGITWFLLNCINNFPTEGATRPVFKALSWINKHAGDLQNPLDAETDKVTGALLTFIKAYEVFKINKYRDRVEAVLNRYPQLVMSNDVTYNGGLAALGEVYLEAFRVFRKNEWKLRANWIENIFLHSYNTHTSGGPYWGADNGTMVACQNKAILHFLLRCLHPQLPPLALSDCLQGHFSTLC